MENKKITYNSLFAGAGGLSEGLISSVYIPVAHVEMDADACNTLRTRACYHFLKQINKLDNYYDYLNSKINREELYELVPRSIIDSVIHETMCDSSMESIYKRIDRIKKLAGIGNIDLVIGGPPCQTYSNVGRSRKCMDNDPRNELYKFYCKVLEKYNPEMFVFENVPGLLTAGKGKYIESIKNEFRSIGYDSEDDIVEASGFGVLQNRKRIIIIGWKRGSRHAYPVLENQTHHFQVNDILSDLSKIGPGQSSNLYRKKEYSAYLRSNGIRTDDDILTWHIARNLTDRDRSIYRIAIREWVSNQRRLKYSDLPDELSTHKNKHGFQDRFKVVAGDLPTSHTITAHISKDGHYYIHPDINQSRSITVREAARIQSFQDNYYFEGSRTAVFKQIGNAVPPLMAKGIAEALIKEFRQEKTGGWIGSD